MSRSRYYAGVYLVVFHRYASYFPLNFVSFPFERFHLLDSVQDEYGTQMILIMQLTGRDQLVMIPMGVDEQSTAKSVDAVH